MREDCFIVNVEAAVLRDDKYLIIRRGDGESHAGGMLSLVGGKVDDAGAVQDVLEETIRREIREEVGIEVKNIRYVESHSFRIGEIAVLDIVFLCEYQSGEAQIFDLDEVAEIFWMTDDAILNHPDVPIWTKESIRRVEYTRERLNL